MSWTALLVLAGGAYLLKAVGLVVVGPMTHRGTPSTAAPADGTTQPGVLIRIGQLLPPALLAALVVSQTVVTGTNLTIDARLAGVVAGGAAVVWKQAPFWLVLIISATVTATIRLVA